MTKLNMKKKSIQLIAKMAIIAGLYVGLTYAFSFMAFLNVQFRISEILVLLVFFRKDYIIPLVIGTFIANIGSPMGILDMGVGTVATLIAVLGIYLISKLKKYFKHEWILLFIASLMPVIVNGLLVGWELYFYFDTPFWINAGYVAIGEFVVVSILGVTLFSMLKKNEPFMNIIISE